MIIILICNNKNLDVNLKEGIDEGEKAESVSMSEDSRKKLNESAIDYASNFENKLKTKEKNQSNEEAKFNEMTMEFFTERSKDCSNYDHQEMVSGQNSMIRKLCQQRNDLGSRNESLRKIN